MTIDEDNETDSAFAHFYLQHAALVAKVVAWKCPVAEREDVAAWVWARVKQKWPLHGVKNVEAYLTRIAQNEVKQFYRHRGAQKRPPPDGRVSLPEDDPSGTDLEPGLVKDPGLASHVDKKRLRENFRELGEELSGTNGDLMERFLDDPSGVSPEEFRKLAASAKKNLKRLGGDVDRLKEGPSFVGHVANKLRRRKGDG